MKQRVVQIDRFRAVVDALRQRFPTAQLAVAEQHAHVDAIVDLVAQPGFVFPISISLQNRDELHLNASEFHCEWFPCSDPGVLERFVDAALGLASGELRIVESRILGVPTSARLQRHVEGRGWRTLARSYRGFWFLMPWPRSHRVMQNVANAAALRAGPIASRGSDGARDAANPRVQFIRQFALRAVICVALGCVVTILAAWAFSLFADPQNGWQAIGHGAALHNGAMYPPTAGPRDFRLNWRVNAHGTFGRVHAFVQYQWVPGDDAQFKPGAPRADALAHTFGVPVVPSAIIDGPAIESTRLIEGAGWPFLALQNELGAASKSKALERTRGFPVTWRFAWFAPLPASVGAMPAPPRELPVRPIWFGLVADTLVYALVIAALWTFVFGARRRRRLRKGECLHCGHALRGAAYCPECGSAAVQL